MRCGVGRCEMRFPDGLGLSGYGPASGAGYNKATSLPLFARAMILEDEGRQRLLLGFVELMGGSQVVTGRLATRLRRKQILDDEVTGDQKKPRDVLLVIPSHTHAAPGHYFGCRLYDALLQLPGGYREDVVDTIVDSLEAAIVAANGALQAADVFVTPALAYGIGRNRSIAAFNANFGHRESWPPPRPEHAALGLDIPPDAPPESSAVDPIFWTVWAYPKGKRDRAIGTFASIGVHNVSLHRDVHTYHPDWAGIAAGAMTAADGGKAEWAAVAQGPAGDVTSIPVGGSMDDMDRLDPAAPGLATRLSLQVAGAWSAARPAADARPVAELDIGFLRWRPRDDGLVSWDIGSPVLSGSDESRTPFLFDPARGEARVATTAMRWAHRAVAKARGVLSADAVRSEREQMPKEPALGAAQLVARRLLDLSPGDEHPLYLVRLGTHVFFGLPSEVTTVAAWRLEQAIERRFQAADKVVRASPIAMVNDYMGYLTTEAEYATQNYEGAMTLYGSRSHEAISAALCSIIDGRAQLRWDLRPELPLPIPLTATEIQDFLERAAALATTAARKTLLQLRRLGGSS